MMVWEFENNNKKEKKEGSDQSLDFNRTLFTTRNGHILAKRENRPPRKNSVMVTVG